MKPPRYTTACFALLSLLLSLPASTLSFAKDIAAAPSVVTKRSSQEVEVALVRSLVSISQTRIDEALKDIDDALKNNPNFRLGQLIKGDLLMARARPLESFGKYSKAQAGTIADLRDEAKARLERYLNAPPEGMLPKNLLKLAPSQKHVLLVDTNKSRLYVFQNQNGEPRYLADYYVTSGKNGSEKLREGDQKTPLGVYFVTANLPKNSLTDFYGGGAFPISYPNEWDRRQGRNGHGIWLHGVPSDTYSRPPKASNGCVVLTNEDLAEIAKVLQIGTTPVVISGQVDWAQPEQWLAERNNFLARLDRWKQDWESLDTERYLKNYASNFDAEGKGLAEWAAQKRMVNAGKTWIKVGLDNVSVFTYPGVDNLVVATFDQDYRSSNLSNQMKKRQYWMRDNNGDWKIVYEGAAHEGTI